MLPREYRLFTIVRYNNRDYNTCTCTFMTGYKNIESRSKLRVVGVGDYGGYRRFIVYFAVFGREGLAHQPPGWLLAVSVRAQCPSIDKEKFKDAYKYATKEKFNFFMIDLKGGSSKILRHNFLEFIKDKGLTV